MKQLKDNLNLINEYFKILRVNMEMKIQISKLEEENVVLRSLLAQEEERKRIATMQPSIHATYTGL